MSVAVGIQDAMRMRHIVICCLLSILPHYLLDGRFSKKKVIAHKMYVLISLQLWSEAFLILRRNE